VRTRTTFSSLDASMRTRWSNHLRSPCQDASYAITSRRPPHIRRVSVRLWRDQRHFRGKTVERCTWCVRGPHFRAWTPPFAPDGAITCARHVFTHRMPSHQVGRHTYAVFRCVYGVISVISGAKLSRGAPGAYEDHIFELGRLHSHQMEQSPALAMSLRIVCHHIKSAATHTPCFGAFMA